MEIASPAARGLFQAILEDPADDVPRLLLADVLEEAGEGERAEFIRVQCELARLQPESLRWSASRHERAVVAANNLQILTLRRRERELLEAHVSVWLEQTYCLPIFWSALKGYSWQATPNNAIFATFRRGFVASVTCTEVDWCGEECRGCNGRGKHQADQQTISPEWPFWHPRNCDCPLCRCPCCHGTGRMGGHGPALVLAAPLEEVRLTEWGGETCRQCNSGFVWQDYQGGRAGTERMTREVRCPICHGLYSSGAALALARQEAGLPALP